MVGPTHQLVIQLKNSAIMIQPDYIVDLLNARNQQLAGHITLGQVVDVIDDIYEQRCPKDDEDEPSLVYIAGKFDNDSQRTYEIGIYPSYSIFMPIEILFKYPRNWQNWFLKKCDSDVLECTIDNGINADLIRKTKWYRQYKNVNPKEFVCRLKTTHELEETAHVMAQFLEAGL